MMKKIVCIALLIFANLSSAQQHQKLLQIDNQTITIDQFKRAYEKNLNLITNSKERDIDYNIKLYVDYQLKLSEAFKRKLDTLPYYKRDVSQYRFKLVAPFLTSQNTVDRLVSQAYYRTKNQRKASHILVRVPKLIKPADTITYYNRIQKIRKNIIEGQKFEDVAIAISEDPSVKKNKGDLGYFGAFRMLYPFENAVYTTKIGEISQPTRTKYGYHIIKPTATRLSKGQVEVANIIVFDTTQVGHNKIKKAYKKLKKGTDFTTVVQSFSEDKNIKQNKTGKLPRFGQGEMLPSLDKQAFALKQIGAYSKPFKSRFGWHIIKLLGRFPVLSLDSLKPIIKEQLQKSGRSMIAKQAVIDSLQSNCNIITNPKALSIFKTRHIDSIASKDLQHTLLTINRTKIKQQDFVPFVKRNPRKSIASTFEVFKEHQLIEYYKDLLVTQNETLKNLLQDYSEGLLIYELMKREIWKKSNDKKALEVFFRKNKSKYANKKLKEIKGLVLSDYQKQLEERFLQKLRSNYQVNIDEISVAKLKKHYNQQK